MFGKKTIQERLKITKQMSDKNADDIQRVQSKDLVKIKRRQDEIERRLRLLQIEVDVRMRHHHG